MNGHFSTDSGTSTQVSLFSACAYMLEWRYQSVSALWQDLGLTQNSLNPAQGMVLPRSSAS